MRTPTVGSRTQRTPDTENDELSELAEVLAVTAKKLAAVTLGRRFTGGKNRPTISDRKKATHCAAWGEVGHWAGAAECKASSNKGGKAMARMTAARARRARAMARAMAGRRPMW